MPNDAGRARLMALGADAVCRRSLPGEMAAQVSDASVLFGPAMVADPYSVYARLRATDPVHWHAPMNAWLVTRYADVAAALRDPRLSSSLGDLVPDAAHAAPGSDARGWEVLQGLLVFVDNSGEGKSFC